MKKGGERSGEAGWIENQINSLIFQFFFFCVSLKRILFKLKDGRVRLVCDKSADWGEEKLLREGKIILKNFFNEKFQI